MATISYEEWSIHYEQEVEMMVAGFIAHFEKYGIEVKDQQKLIKDISALLYSKSSKKYVRTDDD